MYKQSLVIKLFVFFNFILRGCNLQDVTSIVLVYHISNPKQERDWPISLNSQSHLFCRLSLCLQKRLELANPVSYLFDPGRGKNGAVRWLVFFCRAPCKIALTGCLRQWLFNIYNGKNPSFRIRHCF